MLAVEHLSGHGISLGMGDFRTFEPGLASKKDDFYGLHAMTVDMSGI